MSERQLRKLFPKFFGVHPGKVLRAMELFRHTAILMQEENRLILNGNGRHGNSPLVKYELENNCNFSERLKRLLGITYRELLSGAQEEHWAALWMRKWRESLAGSYATGRSPSATGSKINHRLKVAQEGVLGDAYKKNSIFSMNCY